ncbi:MAG TPA: hypothetical protein DDW23_04920 [Planctomycetes bacterium]|nr:hypothetical protein [Planctomycetota bacterium]
MIQAHDKYVFRNFIRQWITFGIGLVGLLAALDLLASADAIANSGDGDVSAAGWAARWVVLEIPFLLVQFAPYVTLLAALTTVLQLRKGREWLPVVVAGRSTLRALAGVFGGAALVAVGTVGVREVVLPRLLPERAAVEHKIFENKDWVMKNIWARGEKGALLQAKAFYPRFSPPELRGVRILHRSSSGEDVDFQTPLAHWIGNKWVFSDANSEMKKSPVTPLALHDIPFNAGFSPRDLTRSFLAQSSSLDLSMKDLRLLLERDSGHRLARTLIWVNSLAPLAHWVLLLLGLPFVLRFERGSPLQGLPLGLLFCALFFVAQFLFQDLGARGVLEPWLAAVCPLLFFGSIGFFAMDRMPT